MPRNSALSNPALNWEFVLYDYETKKLFMGTNLHTTAISKSGHNIATVSGPYYHSSNDIFNIIYISLYFMKNEKDPYPL